MVVAGSDNAAMIFLQRLRANDAVASGRTVARVKIGVIADAHGLPRPEAEQRLAG